MGGYSPGSSFDAILIGYFDGRQFLFCGRVRAGFTKATRHLVYERIQTSQVPDCPFSNLPSRKSGGRNLGGHPTPAIDRHLKTGN